MKKLAIATVMAFTLSGCIGQDALYGKLKDFNLEASDNKFVQEGLFLILWFLPAYEIAFGVDYIVINSIEFWTGENPISGKKSLHGTAKVFHGEDGSVTVASFNKDNTISIDTTMPNGETQHITLSKSENEITATDENGVVLAQVDKATVLQ